MKFKLKARVSRSDARAIRNALGQLAAKGSVKKAVGHQFTSTYQSSSAFRAVTM
jgi:hypothetical protein